MLLELVEPLIKLGILIILIIYSIFALLMVRQADMMTKTFTTALAPVIKAATILHAGVAIGLIVLVFGMLQ